MNERARKGIAATALGVALVAGGALIGQNLSDQNYAATATADAAVGMTEQAEWIASATAEAAEWTQWAVDDQATQDAYATEEAHADATADAESAQAQVDMTATEVAYATEAVNIESTDASISATDNQAALLTRTPVLGMTLTADVFFNATQYAGFVAHQAATMEAAHQTATKEAGGNDA